MATNIFDFFKGQIGQQLSKQISKALNEPESNTNDALQNAVSGLLGGLVGNSNDDQKIKNAFDSVTDNSSNFSGLLDNIEDTLSGDNSSIMNQGENIVSQIFGGSDNNAVNSIIGAIAGSGVNRNSARNLLMTAAPFLYGTIGRQVRDGNMDPQSFQTMIQSQYEYLKNSAPDMLKNLNLDNFSPRVQMDAAAIKSDVEKIQGNVEKLGEDAKKLGDDLRSDIQKKGENLADNAQRASEQMGDSVSKAGDKLAAGAEKADQIIDNTADNISKTADTAGKVAGGVAAGASKSIGDTLKKGFDKAKHALDNTADKVGRTVDRAKEMGEDVGDTVNKVGDTVQKGAGKAQDALDKAADKAGKTLDTAGKATSSVVGGAAKSIGNTFDKGTTKAANTMSGAIDSAGNTLEKGAERAKNTMDGGGFKLGPVIGIIALVLAGVFLFRQCNGGEMMDKAKDTAGEVAGAAGDAVNDAADAVTDALTSLSLPNGKTIDIEPGSYLEKFVNVLGGKEEWDMSKPFVAEGYQFETGSANLTAESRTNVEKLAAALDAYPEATIRLEGYTDNTGNSQANLLLSQNRANTIKSTLEELGVESSRVEALGKGDTNPIADNSTEEGKEKNRRVEVFITHK